MVSSFSLIDWLVVSFWLYSNVGSVSTGFCLLTALISLDELFNDPWGKRLSKKKKTFIPLFTRNSTYGYGGLEEGPGSLLSVIYYAEESSAAQELNQLFNTFLTAN